MPLNNRVIISPAGAGKTTYIIEDLETHLNDKCVILTYTNENYNSLYKKIIQKFGYIPPKVKLQTWFSFLLNECTRPYQNFLYKKRIENIKFVQGQSTFRIPKTNMKYYITRNNNIYTDKISEFICLCNEKSGGMVIERLEKLIDRLYIDEVQDLAGYDFDLLELFLSAYFKTLLVGDNRQATFSTNNSRKYHKFKGSNIVDLFKLWEKDKKCTIEYREECYRCNQEICNLADSIYPEMQPSISRNTKITGHDGLFYICTNQIEDYILKYNPQILKYDKTTRVDGLNFGLSKGLTFDRVLIYPNGPLKNFLKTGDVKFLQGNRSKYYVAFTRARYSVTFVYDGLIKISGIKSLN